MATENGTSGNDTLNGSTGADHLIGGAGDDTYIVNDAGDQVDEGGLSNLITLNNYIQGNDIFIADLTTHTITRINVDGSGIQGNNTSGHAAMSADGTQVVFSEFRQQLCKWRCAL